MGSDHACGAICADLAYNQKTMHTTASTTAAPNEFGLDLDGVVAYAAACARAAGPADRQRAVGEERSESSRAQRSSASAVGLCRGML